MRKALVPARVRSINGSFAAIEHRFLRHGFWATLGHHELLLYFFLILVADRQGLSFLFLRQNLFPAHHQRRRLYPVKKQPNRQRPPGL